MYWQLLKIEFEYQIFKIFILLYNGPMLLFKEIYFVVWPKQDSRRSEGCTPYSLGKQGHLSGTIQYVPTHK